MSQNQGTTKNTISLAWRVYSLTGHRASEGNWRINICLSFNEATVGKYLSSPNTKTYLIGYIVHRTLQTGTTYLQVASPDSLTNSF